MRVSPISSAILHGLHCPRHQSQDRLGGCPRARGFHSGTDGRGAAAALPPDHQPRGGHPVDLQPERTLPGDRPSDRGRRARLAGGLPSPDSRRVARLCLCAPGRRRGAPHDARGLRPRLDGPRRAADPRPDEVGLRRRARGRHRRSAARPPVPGHLQYGEDRPHRYRHRREPGVRGVRRGEPGQADLQRPAPQPGAADRRRRDHHPGRAPPVRARREAHRGGQPHPGARQPARRAVRRPCGAAFGDPRGVGQQRYRHQLYCQPVADPRQGRRGARAEAAQAQADVHGRHRRAARHRAGSRRTGRRLPL
ncbi:hypothetical protein PAERUG_P54_1_London_24_VIM_2_04_13_05143 [Pseudomonas aeruginosa]|nr:hypothetical protein PAERUG_P54_1_London_24_VIM_2_04_13_05143 [Pseudomonas aeruginosa]